LFGIGGTELAIILLFGFLIFGPDKMPEIARTIGRMIKQFQNAQDQMNKVLKEEVLDPIKDMEPLMNPFAAVSADDKAKDSTSADIADEKGAPTPTEPKEQAEDHLTSPKEAEEARKPGPADLQKALVDDANKRRLAASARDQSTAVHDSFAARRARLEESFLRQDGEEAQRQTASKTPEEGTDD